MWESNHSKDLFSLLVFLLFVFYTSQLKEVIKLKWSLYYRARNNYCFCCCKLYFINFILSENIILMTVSQFTLISIVELGRKMKKVGYKRY